MKIDVAREVLGITEPFEELTVQIIEASFKAKCKEVGPHLHDCDAQKFDRVKSARARLLKSVTKCEVCGGTGIRVKQIGFYQHKSRCYACNGTGKKT